jgi:Arc/MetJ-type ribon-helix-helix transcriptional regulator
MAYGRPQRFDAEVMVRLSGETIDKIDRVRAANESRSDFIRDVIERALQEREAELEQRRNEADQVARLAADRKLDRAGAAPIGFRARVKTCGERGNVSNHGV